MEQPNGSGGASGATEQAKEKAQEAKEQATSQLRTQVDQRSTETGQKISTQASDMRTVAEKLREEGKDGPAKAAEQVAERVEKVGSYLEQSDADRILSDVEGYARQNPWAVVAGGIAAGFVASRFLRASSDKRVQTQTQSRPALPQQSLSSGTPTGNGFEPSTPASGIQGGQSADPIAPPTTPTPAGV